MESIHLTLGEKRIKEKRRLIFVFMFSVLLLISFAAYTGNTNADAQQQLSGIEEQPDKSVEVKKTPIVGIRTDKILKAMGDYLKAAKQFSYHAEITFDEVLPSGQKIQYSSTSDLALSRPDHIHVESSSHLGDKRFWYDGKNMVLLDVGREVYAKESVTGNLEEALDYIVNKFGFAPPLSDFVYQDIYEALMRDIVFGFYVDLQYIDGARCHHLAFVENNIDWQVWIEDSKQMVPRKIVITYKNISSSPQYSAVFSDWEMDPYLPEAMFNADLTITDDFEKIEFLAITESITEKSEEKDKS